MERSAVSEGLKSYYLVPKALLGDTNVRQFLQTTSQKIARNLGVVNKRAGLRVKAALAKQGDVIGPSMEPITISRAASQPLITDPVVDVADDEVRAGDKRPWAADDFISVAKSARVHGKPGKQNRLIQRKNPYLGLKRVLAAKEPPKSRGIQTLPLNPRPFAKRPVMEDVGIQLNETDFPEYLLGNHRGLQTDPIEPAPEYPTLVDLLPKRHRINGYILLEHIQSTLDIDTDDDEDILMQIVYYLVSAGSEPPAYWMGQYLETIMQNSDFPIEAVEPKKRGYLTPEYLRSGLSREKTHLRSRLQKRF
jgi:hypothetical protein